MYLFRFDTKDGEAPSEGEDDEDANGNFGSDGSWPFNNYLYASSSASMLVSEPLVQPGTTIITITT